MKITPLEIRQKTFEKVFRGYEKDEVNAYLQSLSMEWERMLDENKELFQRIENLETESSKLRELESSLFKTLKTAEDTGATLIEQAKKETDLKLKESDIKAESILTDARNKAKSLVEHAEARKRQILDEMINQVKTMESLFSQMVDLKETVIGQIKVYSNDLMERVEKLEKKSENVQIHDIVSQAKKIYNSSIVGEDLDFNINSVVSSETKETEKPISEGEMPVEKQEIEEKEHKGDDEVILEGGVEVEMGIVTEKEIHFEEQITVDEEEPPEEVKKIEKTNLVDVENDEEVSEKNIEEEPEIGFSEKKKEPSPTTKSFFDDID